jgi:hypothetical protein
MGPGASQPGPREGRVLIIDGDNSALGIAIGPGPVQSGANDVAKVAMSKEPENLVVPKARLTMGAPSSVARSTYRVSKAQSLMMRAHDARVEAAEAKKAKAAEKKQAKADKTA